MLLDYIVILCDCWNLLGLYRVYYAVVLRYLRTAQYSIDCSDFNRSIAFYLRVFVAATFSSNNQIRFMKIENSGDQCQMNRVNLCLIEISFCIIADRSEFRQSKQSH